MKEISALMLCVRTNKGQASIQGSILDMNRIESDNLSGRLECLQGRVNRSSSVRSRLHETIANKAGGLPSAWECIVEVLTRLR
ncbi:hypothetical protein AB4344_22910, partial [Vibrio breoganii]